MHVEEPEGAFDNDEEEDSQDLDSRSEDSEEVDEESNDEEEVDQGRSNEESQDSDVTSTSDDDLTDEGNDVSSTEEELSEESNTEAELSEQSNDTEEEEEEEEEAEEEEENVVADMGSGWGRILFHPVRRGKRVIVDVCSSANKNGSKGSLDRITLSSTTNKVLHFQARRSRWGDLWPCGGACGRVSGRAR